MDLAIMGIGSGSKGAIAGYVKNFIPDVGVDMAALLAGGALYYFGDRIDPLVRKFGAGVLIAAIGQMTSGLTGGLLGGKTQTQNQNQNPGVSTENQLKRLAEMEACRS